jgi:serine protease
MTTSDGAVGRDDVIVLRLKRPTSADVEDLAETRSPLAAFLEAHGLASNRAILSVPPTRILAWESEARGGPFAPPYSLTAFWLLDARNADQPMKTLLAGLRRLAGVAEAYRQPRYEPTVATPVNDIVYAAGGQGYLGSAPQGIDAEWAWRLQPSRDGVGARFVDVELGWQAGHEDVSPLPPLAGGVNRQGTSGAYHGLGVLGILNARTNNLVGIAGAAPGASALVVASARYPNPDPRLADDPAWDGVNVADALMAANSACSAGDIVLIELQTVTGAPVESASLEHTAIMLMVSGGKVVVEAAGDAAVQLTTYAGVAADSGAIIVAGAHSALPHTWDQMSNWGGRVDAYAWGESVYTTGGSGNPPAAAGAIAQDAPNRYTIDFDASSSAAAIVAGAALVVQGAYKASTLGALTPSQLRNLFRTTGTPGDAMHPIGRMPDLRQLLPDVYIRDNLADDGTVPTAGALSISPDVIVTTAAAADPQGTYGAGSPNENVDTLGEQVEFGQTNYVYVRMKNRGTGIASGCRATVYWSEPATLVTPSVWTLIGTTAPVDVGPSLTVTDAIPWNAVPATGHYCFVAVVDHPLDPAPPPPTGSWTQYFDFIRNNNNVTWRNFNVVDLVANAPTPAPFMIRGAPDSRRTFDLEILQEPAGKVEIDFEVPLELSRGLVAAPMPKPVIDKERQVAVFRLPRKRTLKVPGVVLQARAAFPCRFVIRGAAPDTGRLPTVAIRQVFKNVEVGRVTWAYRTRR